MKTEHRQTDVIQCRVKHSRVKTIKNILNNRPDGKNMVYKNWIFWETIKDRKQQIYSKEAFKSKFQKTHFMYSTSLNWTPMVPVIVAISLALTPLDIHLRANNSAHDIQYTIVW